MKRKLLLAALCVVGALGMRAQEVGDQYIVGTSVYQITGTNLITNGSFDNDVNNWYNGAWTANSIEGSTITNAGGFDDGAYITISAAGAGSNSTLRNVVPVENGKTYLFRCYTSGQTPSRANIGYSGLWKGTGTDGHTEGDQLYRMQWGERCGASTSNWTVNNYIFTPDDYTFVVIRSSWNSNTKFDGFFIGEVSKVSDITETVAWGDWTGTMGTASGQHWNGNGSATYNDNASWWSSNTWEKNQDINLPAGAYVLKAAGRGAANDGTDTYISLDGNNLFFWSKGDTGKGIDTSGAENYSSDGTYANNNNGRGWEWRNLPLLLFEAKDGVTAKFGYRVNYTNNPSGSWSWAGICDPTLYKTDLTTPMILPSLRQAIAKGQVENDKNAGGSRSIAAALSAAKAISASSSVSDATTAYTALLTAIPVASDYAEKYALLDNEITKATAIGIASSDISTAEAVRDNNSATADQLVAATQNLKVAEYNYVNTTYQYGVSLGEWNSTGTNTEAATFNNEHWSGTTHDYKNQKDVWSDPKQGYAAASWSINFSQNVALPAGNYVFKVAGRQASGDKVTTSLVVTKTSDSSVLGTVSDFPRSNSSRGINKDGATAFEGEDSEFANDGKGYGWEWRYVKFSLAEGATVNVAISSVATDYNQWVSFGDYTLQTDNEANIALITYNVALANAQTIIADGQYSNVTGSEKTELQAAIDADVTLNKNSKTEIEAATTALNNAATAFTAAKSAYNTYVAAKAAVYEDNLPYASSTKFAAIGTAQSATDATSASDATTKTNAIINAYRLYVESNAMAEGVEGAEDKTSLISNPNLDVTILEMTAGAWTFTQSGGSAQILSGESFTDGSGSSGYTYFDYNNTDNNNQHLFQTISDLPAGRYLLTASARAATAFNNYFYLSVKDGEAAAQTANIPAVGNSGGTFGRGWNDTSIEFVHPAVGDVEVKVYSDGGSGSAKRAGWWGATRFRLVRLGDAAESVTVSSVGWATLYSDNALDFSGTGLTAYTATISENTVTLTEVKNVPACTGVVLKGDAATYSIPMIASSETAKGDLEGSTTEATAYDAISGKDLYMLALNAQNEVQFTKVTSGSIAAGKAYLPVAQSSNPAKLRVVFGDNATAINGVEGKKAENGVMYNLAGQRVGKDYKGIVIVNGKKVMNK